MSILFLNSENKINEQEKLLMQSLLNNSKSLIYACPENSSLAIMANSANIPFIEVPISFGLQLFSLRKYIKKNSITTIHVLDQKAFRIARYIKMTLGQSINIIVSHHDPIDCDDPKAFKAPSAYAIQAFLDRKVQKLFVSSFELYNVLQSKRSQKSNIGFLPYAIDMGDVFPVESPSQRIIKHDPDKRFVFIIDTELEKNSGLELLFEALVELKEQMTENDPVIEIHICGSGSLFQELIDKASELNVASGVAFLGSNDTHVFYKNAHAIICPASSGEGNYRSILNGWRASLPVICSDISVHTKLVVSGRSNQSALMFPRDSAQTLAQCMLEVIRNKSEYASLIATGKNMLQLSAYDNLESKYLK